MRALLWSRSAFSSCRGVVRLGALQIVCEGAASRGGPAVAPALCHVIARRAFSHTTPPTPSSSGSIFIIDEAENESGRLPQEQAPAQPVTPLTPNEQRRLTIGVSAEAAVALVKDSADWALLVHAVSLRDKRSELRLQMKPPLSGSDPWTAVLTLVPSTTAAPLSAPNAAPSRFRSSSKSSASFDASSSPSSSISTESATPEQAPKVYTGKNTLPVLAFRAACATISGVSVVGGIDSTTQGEVSGCTVHRLMRSLAPALFALGVEKSARVAIDCGCVGRDAKAAAAALSATCSVRVEATAANGDAPVVVGSESGPAFSLLRVYRGALRNAVLSALPDLPSASRQGLVLRDPEAASRWMPQHPLNSAAALVMHHHRTKLVAETEGATNQGIVTTTLFVNSREGVSHVVGFGRGGSKLASHVAAVRSLIEHNFPELAAALLPLLKPTLTSSVASGATSAAASPPSVEATQQPASSVSSQALANPSGELALLLAAETPPRRIRVTQWQLGSGEDGTSAVAGSGWATEIVVLPARTDDGSADAPAKSLPPPRVVGSAIHARKGDSLVVAATRAFASLLPAHATPFMESAVRRGLLAPRDAAKALAQGRSAPTATTTTTMPAQPAAVAAGTMTGSSSSSRGKLTVKVPRGGRRMAESRLSLLRRAVQACASDSDRRVVHRIEEELDLEGSPRFVAVLALEQEDAPEQHATAAPAGCEIARERAAFAVLATLRAYERAFETFVAKEDPAAAAETRAALAAVELPVASPAAIEWSVLDLLAWGYGHGAAVLMRFPPGESFVVAQLFACAATAATGSSFTGLQCAASSPAATAAIADPACLLAAGFGDNEDEAVANALLRCARVHFPGHCTGLPKETDAERCAAIGHGFGASPADEVVSTTPGATTSNSNGEAITEDTSTVNADGVSDAVLPTELAPLTLRILGGNPATNGPASTLGAADSHVARCLGLSNVVVSAFYGSTTKQWTVSARIPKALHLPGDTPAATDAPTSDAAPSGAGNKKKGAPKKRAGESKTEKTVKRGKKLTKEQAAAAATSPYVTAASRAATLPQAVLGFHAALANAFESAGPAAAAQAEAAKVKAAAALRGADELLAAALESCANETPGATTTPARVVALYFSNVFGWTVTCSEEQVQAGRRALHWSATVSVCVAPVAVDSSPTPLAATTALPTVLPVATATSATKKGASRGALLLLLRNAFPAAFERLQNAPAFVDVEVVAKTELTPAPAAPRGVRPAAAAAVARAAAARESTPAPLTADTAARTVEQALRAAMLARVASPCELRVEEQRFAGGFLVRLYQCPVKPNGEVDLTEEAELVLEKGSDRHKVLGLACYKVMQRSFARDLREALKVKPDLVRALLA